MQTVSVSVDTSKYQNGKIIRAFHDNGHFTFEPTKVAYNSSVEETELCEAPLEKNYSGTVELIDGEAYIVFLTYTQNESNFFVVPILKALEGTYQVNVNLLSEDVEIILNVLNDGISNLSFNSNTIKKKLISEQKKYKNDKEHFVPIYYGDDLVDATYSAAPFKSAMFINTDLVDIEELKKLERNYLKVTYRQQKKNLLSNIFSDYITSPNGKKFYLDDEQKAIAYMAQNVLSGEDEETFMSASLLGMSGTGKTEFARAIAHTLGYELVIVNAQDFTTPDEVMYKIDMDNGTTDYTLSPLVLALMSKKPTIVLVDELNRGLPTIQNVLLGLLDNRHSITVRGDVYLAESRKVVFLTYNEGSEHGGILSSDAAIIQRPTVSYRSMINEANEKLIIAESNLDAKTKHILSSVKDAIRKVNDDNKHNGNSYFVTRSLVQTIEVLQKMMQTATEDNYILKFEMGMKLAYINRIPNKDHRNTLMTAIKTAISASNKTFGVGF